MAKDILTDTHKDSIIMMRTAMDMYERGNIAGGHEQMVKAFDLMCDADAPYDIDSNGEKVDDDILYGESRNFGIVYRVLQEAIKNEALSKKGKDLIKKTVNTIKADNILKEEFSVYNALANDNTDDADGYVNEMISTITVHPKRKLRESNEKLLGIVKNNKLNEFVEVTDDEIELFEAIDYLFTTKKNMNNLNDYLSAKNTVRDYIGRKETKIVENKSDIDEVYAFDEKCTDLHEDEKKFIDCLLDEKTDKKNLFYEYKDNALRKVNAMMKNCTADEREKMEEILSTITECKYDTKTVVDDILKFAVIQDTLDE